MTIWAGQDAQSQICYELYYLHSSKPSASPSNKLPECEQGCVPHCKAHSRKSAWQKAFWVYPSNSPYSSDIALWSFHRTSSPSLRVSSSTLPPLYWSPCTFWWCCQDHPLFPTSTHGGCTHSVNKSCLPAFLSIVLEDKLEPIDRLTAEITCLWTLTFGFGPIFHNLGSVAPCWSMPLWGSWTTGSCVSGTPPHWDLSSFALCISDATSHAQLGYGLYISLVGAWTPCLWRLHLSRPLDPLCLMIRQHGSTENWVFVPGASQFWTQQHIVVKDGIAIESAIVYFVFGKL